MTGHDYVSVAIRTADPDRAESLIRGNTGVYSVAPGDTSAFSFSLRRGGDSRGMISDFSYGAAFETANVHEMYTAASVTAGAMRWEMGDLRGTGADGPFLQRPGVRMRTVGDRVTAIGTSLPRWFVEQVARQDAGADRVTLRKGAALPLDAARAQHWLRLSAFAASTRDAGGLQHELVRAAVLRNLAAGVLVCFGLLPEPLRRAGRALPGAQEAVYRRGRAFLDDHASLPITISDAAQHVGVPIGILAKAFAAHAPSGMSPAQYLRRARLSAAHADLVAGDPTLGDTVGAIALQWGFASPGAFARLHRQVYGRNPRWVLAR